MSNIIPIVSSSPPPFDDDGGWDDEDGDDFGNFASAQNTDFKEKNKNDFFEVDWSATDAFQTAEESSGSNSVHETTAPNGLTDEPHGFNESVDLNIPKQSHQVSNLEQEGNTTALNKGEDSLPTNIDQNDLSDIPINAAAGAQVLDSNISSELEVSNTVPESKSELPNTEENETLSASKFAESVVSNASITDSGVFSSDLSPSSYPESSSTLQNSCDNHSSPNSYLSVTAEISDTHCNGESQDENHQKLFEKTQAKEDSSQNEVPMPGSFSDNCDSGENDGDWGDFSDANSFNSMDKENLPVSAFEENVHSTSTADKVDDDNLKENSVHNPSSDSNRCEESEEEEKEGPDHTSSNTNSTFVSLNDDYPPRKEDSDFDTKNEQELEIDDNSQSEECNYPGKITSSENQKTVESSQSVPLEDASFTTQECSLLNKEECNVSDDIENDTVLGKDTSVNGEIEMELKDEHLAEKSSTNISFNNDEGENVKEKDVIIVDKNQSGETDDHFLYIEGESACISPDPEKDEAVDSHVKETANVNIIKNTKDVDFDDSEFGSFGKKNCDLSDEVTPITFRTSVCESDEDKKEDADEEKPPPFDDGEDDDFGDFGDFSSMPAAGLSDGADDFGGFDSGIKDKPEKSFNFRDDGDDDFGEFGDANTSGDQGAGWADFGSSNAPTFESPSESSSKDFVSSVSPAVTTTIQGKNKIAMALEKCFLGHMKMSPPHSIQPKNEEGLRDPEPSSEVPEEEITGLDVVIELGLANIQEAKQQTWTVVQHPAKKDPRVRVWGQMKDVDASHALGYSWPTSHCSQEVFNTLHIDTQNILFTQKKQAVPFFASGLGILEPTRGGNSVTDTKKEKNSGLGMPLQPTLLDTTTNNKQPPLPAAQDIPPVDFDWSVSGLTNPLTANTLDLDFLVVQGSDSCEKTSDEWDWVFKNDAESGASTQPGLQPLEEMLKKSTPTAKLTPQEVLSQEAQTILTKMPDLSFMQSKVLMFPVKQ